VARWEIHSGEILDADEEIIVAATREGLGELHRLAAVPDAERERDAGDEDEPDDHHAEPPTIIDRAEHHPTSET
jgi:hypothetical protein